MVLGQHIKVLLVEDEPLWQQGIAALLDLEDDMLLEGVAESYNEAITVYSKVNPDIVLLDWKILGAKDGLDVAKTLFEQGHPKEKLILVSGSSRDLIPDLWFSFVPKPEIASLLVATIRQLAH